MNVGEELCGEWLRHVKRCEFVQYNLKTSHVQGEIDVIGINLAERIVYLCEVAVHLTTGLQYVKDKRPDNVGRLTAKFRKDVAFARSSFPGFEHVFMLWSPIVKAQTNRVYDQAGHVNQVIATLRAEERVEIEPVINESFLSAIEALRKIARDETKELDSPVMRTFQVEEHLRRFLARKGRSTG